MSVSIEVTLSGFPEVEAYLGRIAGLDEARLLTAIGAIGESQTRRRIEEEKTAPDGTPWPPNREGTSILLRTGRNLRDSIAHVVGSGMVAWGASWELAHVHQNGATIEAKNGPRLVFQLGGERVFARRVTIPPRPFVGLSQENGREIVRVVTDWLGRLGGRR